MILKKHIWAFLGLNWTWKVSQEH